MQVDTRKSIRFILGIGAALVTGLFQLNSFAENAHEYYAQPTPINAHANATTVGHNELVADIERRLAALEIAAGRQDDAAPDAGYSEVKIITKPTHKLRGRMYFDQIWMGDLNGAVPQAQENVTGFDTIRLGVTGNIYENIKYTAEFEFEGEEVDYKDVFAEVTLLPYVGHVRIGHFKEPMGLEQQTSSRFVSFMERSSPTVAFTPSRNVGVMLHNHIDDAKNYSWYIGMFRGSHLDMDEDVDADSNDWAATGRIAALLYYDEATPGRCLLHAGVSGSHRRTGEAGGSPGNGDWEGSLELDSRDSFLNIELGNPMLGDPRSSSEFSVVAAEAAWVRGPLSVQGEFMYAATGDAAGINAWGAYGQVSYFVTGENRGYKKGSKAFDRVKPYEPFFLIDTPDGVAGGLGAWEVAARWSWTDLESVPALANAGVITVPPTVIGTQENIALGVNWYLNPYSRMMFNYIHSVSNYTFLGKSEGDHLGLRFQIDW
jgi:phosphate-selective porin OprO/OprP